MAAAKHQFMMNRAATGGAPMADHVAVARRMGLKVPKAPTIPPTLKHVWNWFCELSNARVPGNPITFESMTAWCALTGRTLRPEEVRLIRCLDNEFLKVSNG